MAYYTYYSIDITTSDLRPLDRIAHENIITTLQEEYDLGYIFDCETGLSEAETTWYEHEEDMKKFSEKYPTLLFTLHGTGEETGDLWRAYFKNGKVQNCPAIITFDPYDKSKLV